MDLEGFESVGRWLTKLSKKSGSENTRRAYLRWLDMFCTFVGMNPDQLISSRRRDLKSCEEIVRMHHEELLERWFVELGRRYSRNTCALAYNAVRSFYAASYSRLEVEGVSTWSVKRGRRLRREELEALLKALRLPMHRAYVLCQAQSGLSVSDLLKLTYGDIKEQLESGEAYIHLENRREKVKEAGYHDSFFGRQAVEALKQYLETRSDLMEDQRLFPCTDRNINIMLERASMRASIDHVSSHDLRKFFDSHMKLRVRDAVLVDWWMGHFLDRIRRTYSIPPAEEQLKEYMKGEENITVHGQYNSMRL